MIILFIKWEKKLFTFNWLYEEHIAETDGMIYGKIPVDVTVS